ncbi:hypothetical protein ON010_g16503 [Phytophthora cinnamomi]|nr:hypothetical protein ON010_g16503 [Phytophthora cinnamomi]
MAELHDLEQSLLEGLQLLERPTHSPLLRAVRRGGHGQCVANVLAVLELDLRGRHAELELVQVRDSRRSERSWRGQRALGGRAWGSGDGRASTAATTRGERHAGAGGHHCAP